MNNLQQVVLTGLLVVLTRDIDRVMQGKKTWENLTSDIKSFIHELISMFNNTLTPRERVLLLGLTVITNAYRRLTTKMSCVNSQEQ